MKPLYRLAGFLVFVGASSCLAQRWGGEGWLPNADTIRTAREAPSHSTGTPVWTNAPGFGRDVFTFARIRDRWAPRGSWSAGNWHTDFPDSDLNLSYRLEQMTAIKADPDGRVLDSTDKELFDYPWWLAMCASSCMRACDSAVRLGIVPFPLRRKVGSSLAGPRE